LTPDYVMPGSLEAPLNPYGEPTSSMDVKFRQKKEMIEKAREEEKKKNANKSKIHN
jgi:hypothetical protein